jgi:iron complex outermembrane receptor protein
MYRSIRAPLVSAAAIGIVTASAGHHAFAQSSGTEPGALPPVVVQQSATVAAAKKSRKKKKKTATKQTTTGQSGAPSGIAAAGTATGELQSGTQAAVGSRSGSLTSPTAAEARAEINRTPGGVEVVPGSAYKTSTPATTVKDALDYVPGVLIRPNEGEQASHFSIRGSGLSRNADARGVQFLMDGLIPLTRATGDTAFDEIDPNAFSYVEVYKGANALQFGANGLGGAVNFVSPTGYDSHLFGARLDVGSFGFVKWTATSGGVYGPADYFISLSGMQEDGYREHSDGENLRGLANIGYKITPDAETRFYFLAADTQRHFAGGLTKEQALSDPSAAFVKPGVLGGFPPSPNGNDNIDWDIGKKTDSVRFANKTTLRLTPETTLEFGAFYLQRDIEQPVFVYITYDGEESGGFARLVDDRLIGGFRNRLIAGTSRHNGTQHQQRFVNILGTKGPLVFDADQDSENRTFYAEDSFFMFSDLALVAGVQHVHAKREQTGFLVAQSGTAEFDFWSPKFGVLWDVTRNAQLFANISQSGEAPTFSEISITAADTIALKPQEAITYEIGTRGGDEDFNWDVSLYRSEITNEFQCLTSVAGTGFCTQVNIGQSIHQGVEIGAGAAIAKGLIESGPERDGLWLKAAYTFSDFRYDDDPDMGNNELPGQPRHYLRAELLYKHPSGLYFGPNVEWVPESYYVDNENKMTADPYHLWGAKLGFDNGGRIAAYVEARNLADEAYISSVNVASTAVDSSTLFMPGTGRAIYSGVQFRW